MLPRYRFLKMETLTKIKANYLDFEIDFESVQLSRTIERMLYACAVFVTYRNL